MLSYLLRLKKVTSRRSGYDGAGDSSLIERARVGDADAFGALYLRYLDPIYRYVYFRVGARMEAEDITEQVFLNAWEALPRYKERSYPFSSWLYRIANNMVVDYHRIQKRVAPTELTDEAVTQDARANLSEQVIREEELALLTRAIACLPADQQQVITLRFVEGLSHREIAGLLQKSEGACRTLQYRALAALGQELEQCGAK